MEEHSAGRGPFALNLLDLVRDRLRRATPSYLSLMLAHRGEDLFVLSEGAWSPPDYLVALRAEVPVDLPEPPGPKATVEETAA